jgi:hypothetical protein
MNSTEVSSLAAHNKPRHHDGSTTLYFSDVAIAQNEVGLLAGKCDMAALLTAIQMSPTLTFCRVLYSTSPIVLVDSGSHLFARLADPTMEEPGENFVFLRKKKNGAVFAKVKTAPENSPAHQPESGCICHQRRLTVGHGRSSRCSSDRQQAV